MQNEHEFKSYQLRKKFIFRQLVTKIVNFVVIRRNNSVLTQKRKRKKKRHFKAISHEISEF